MKSRNDKLEGHKIQRKKSDKRSHLNWEDECLCSDIIKTSSCLPSFLPYLYDGVDGRVSSEAEVSTGDIVTYGCRQHAHRDAELLVVGPGLVQLQQGLKGLMVVAAMR